MKITLLLEGMNKASFHLLKGAFCLVPGLTGM